MKYLFCIVCGAVALIVCALCSKTKRPLVWGGLSGILGVGALYFLSLPLFAQTVFLELNPASIAVSGLLGIPGVVMLLVLELL